MTQHLQAGSYQAPGHAAGKGKAGREEQPPKGHAHQQQQSAMKEIPTVLLLVFPAQFRWVGCRVNQPEVDGRAQRLQGRRLGPQHPP